MTGFIDSDFEPTVRPISSFSTALVPGALVPAACPAAGTLLFEVVIMTWTPETVARLHALKRKGLSAAKIAEQLGLTRNAVIGKLYREAGYKRASAKRRSAHG